MQARFVAPGMTIPHTPTAALAAGEVVVQDQLVGVTTHPVEANQLCGLTVQGVFDFAKATGGSIAVGALVYWNNTTKVATTTATGNTLIGKCIRAASNTDTTVRVLLTP